MTKIFYDLSQAFTLPFVPEHSPLRITDIIGLIIICGGLGCYRFAADAVAAYYARKEDNGSVKEPLLHLLQDADNVIHSTADPSSEAESLESGPGRVYKEDQGL